MVKYSLIGVDGNCFAILGYVKKAMRREGKSQEEIAAYDKEAKRKDYDHLLYVSAMKVEELNEPYREDYDK